MERDTIQSRCDHKIEELLEKYFGNLVYEAAYEKAQTLDESRYSMGLPAKVEAEYRSFLGELLVEVSPEKDIDEILNKHHLSVTFTEDDRQQLEKAYKDAKIITVWEKITKSNHEDVTYYKGLLKEYTEELLKWMEIDFMEDIE